MASSMMYKNTLSFLSSLQQSQDQHYFVRLECRKVVYSVIGFTFDVPISEGELWNMALVIRNLFPFCYKLGRQWRGEEDCYVTCTEPPWIQGYYNSNNDLLKNGGKQQG